MKASLEQATEETALVLPGGTIHILGLTRYGAVIAPDGPVGTAVRNLWERGQDGARHHNHPVLLRAWLPDGREEARLLAAGKNPARVPARLLRHDARPDARWDGPIPDRKGLLTAATGALESGQAALAAATAGRLADELRSTLGVHPYAVLALELHARCEAAAEQWERACLLYQTAAVARHHLGAPGPAENTDAHEAVTAWLRWLDSPAAAGESAADAQMAGFLLGHHLVSICPAPRALVAGVLEALEKLLPAIRGRMIPLRPHAV